MTVIRRSDGREWRIEPSGEGIPLVFGDGKYDHDQPRVASKLESALAEQLEGAVERAEKAEALARKLWAVWGEEAERLHPGEWESAELLRDGGQ